MEIDIKKIFSKLSFSKGKDVLKKDTNPYRDWAILFVVFTILVVGVGVGSAYMFIQIEQEDLFNATNGREKEVKEFNTKKFNEATNAFEKKSRKLKELRTTHPTIIDPAQ